MPVTSTPVFCQTPKNGKVQILPGDTQNQKTVYTGGTNGSKISCLMAVSTDTSARDVQISITNGGTSYPIGTVTVAIGAGNSGTVAATNMFTTQWLPGIGLDSDGNPEILLISGDTLTVSALSTVSTNKAITVTCMAADF